MNDLPQQIRRIFESNGLGEVMRVLSLSGRDSIWQVSTKDQDYFCKQRRYSFFSLQQEQFLYHSLYDLQLGLKPILIHQNFLVFPWIKYLHQGNFQPKLFAKNLFKMHCLPRNIPSISLIQRSEFYLREAEEMMDKNSQIVNLQKHQISLLQGEIACLEMRLKDFSEELGICHCDLSYDNLLWDSHRLLFLDCEYAGLLDIYFDFAGARTFLNAEDFSIFIGEYASLRQDFKLNQDKLDLYIQYKNLVDHSWTYWYQVRSTLFT